MTMIPTVHLNGTSRDELARMNLEALDAVRKAIGALHAAAPNGRDYYPQGPRAWEAARLEHEKLSHKLADVVRELMAIVQGITDQPE